jgi:hypothetical protein
MSLCCMCCVCCSPRAHAACMRAHKPAACSHHSTALPAHRAHMHTHGPSPACVTACSKQFLVLHGSLQHREEHLLRVTPWAQLQHHLPALEQRLLQAAQLIVGLSDSEVGPLHKEQLQLPHRHGGMGLVSFSEPLADTAFVSAAARWGPRRRSCTLPALFWRLLGFAGARTRAPVRSAS